MQLEEKVFNEERPVRFAALESLIHLKPPNLTETLLKLLADEALSNAVAGHLADLKEGTIIPALLTEMTHPAAFRRKNAAYILGHLADRSVIPALIQLLDDESHYVRKYAAFALGKLRATEAVASLCRELQLTADLEYACFIVIALGELQKPEVIPVLLDTIENKRKVAKWSMSTGYMLKSLEQNIIEALARINDPQQLLAAFDHPNPDVRRIVVTALGKTS